jgi:hypothetical protein
LRRGDVLALFWDESTAEVAQYVTNAAETLGIDTRRVFASLRYQAAFRANDDLTLESLEAMGSSRAILTCVSSHTAGTDYRSALLRVGTDHDKRFGLLPGATLDILGHSVTIDYAQAVAHCDDFALALTAGKTAALTTYVFDEAGKELERHELTFDLGEFGRPAVTSTGIVPVGTWGNLPGGETFIAPIEDTAEGTFVLNGAFKNCVVEAPKYLVLRFHGGRVTSVHGDAELAPKFESLLEYARSKRDRHFDALAELGIGVNPGITRLTGNALFDEKCAGTAHIAIGDGTGFGGVYSSCIHEDLISWKPSLTIDDHPVLSYGQNVFQSEHWRESFDDPKLGAETFHDCDIVRRTDVRNEWSKDGRLKVRRDVEVGRVCNYTVGEPETSISLCNLYSLVPQLPDFVSVDRLRAKVCQAYSLSPTLFPVALAILRRHGLVEVTSRDYR